MTGFQTGVTNINLDSGIQSGSFILITVVTQRTGESVRNDCNLCWHICERVTGQEGRQDRGMKDLQLYMKQNKWDTYSNWSEPKGCYEKL